MRFFDTDSQEISLEEVKGRFPEISSFLSQDEVDFLIEGNLIKVINNYGNPVFINIKSTVEYHKKFFTKHSVHKEPIFKACGLHQKSGKHLFDTTGGFLGDSLLLYSMGAKISVFERNPVAIILGLNALKNTPLENFKYYPFDINKEVNFSECDTIFFDPMYQVVNNKTKPKLEMQVFRDYVGADLDAHETFKFLLHQNKRLVVKRSIKAPPFSKADVIYEGKSTSYDVYLPKN